MGGNKIDFIIFLLMYQFFVDVLKSNHLLILQKYKIKCDLWKK
jgi:hypothetical protein